MSALPRLDFIIYKDASTTEFLQPFGCLTTVRNLETLLDYYDHELGQGYTHVTRQVIPVLMRDKIIEELGVTKFSSSIYFFNSHQDQADYIVKFFDPEEYLMFKLAYFGARV
jgi:hypothetical protein